MSSLKKFMETGRRIRCAKRAKFHIRYDVTTETFIFPDGFSVKARGKEFMKESTLTEWLEMIWTIRREKLYNG